MSLVTNAELAPVGHRSRWIAGGLAVQAAGLGGPAALVLERIRSRDNAAGTAGHLTLRLIASGMAGSRIDMVAVALGAAVFAGGSVVLARPFVTRRLTLILAVPAAAVAGLAALGVLALLCSIAVLFAEAGASGSGSANGGSSRRRASPPP